jgi:hypothetical protein
MPREDIEELEAQLAFMRSKLMEMRETMEGMDPVYAATSTQGEVVPKRNPMFDIYPQLMRCYCSTLNQLEGMDGVQADGPKLVEFERFARTMKRTADA